MSHLIVSNLTKTVGDKTLFKNVEFTIYEGERAGLIGINGTGKSTLLSILAGEQEADSIEMDHPNKYRIAYLPQKPVFEENVTVLQAVFSGNSPILQLNREYEEVVKELSLHPESETLQNKLFQLQQRMDAEKAWDVNALAKQALTKLGIDMFDEQVSNLSGGQQKRVALAKVLIEPADLCLLDEPTNHLDAEATEWLQEAILRLKGAVLFITHDRYFLDAVATHIYELADQTLYRHNGNYSDFLEARAIREENKQATQEKLRNRYRNELKWIRRGAKARTTKQKARIQRFEELEKKLEQYSEDDKLELAPLSTTRLGKKVLEGVHLSKSFGDRTILKDFNFLIQQGDRIGIVGANGYGKSTLLKILAGELKPDEGEVITGPTVKIAHFHQILPEMNENQRMIEYVREASNEITDTEGFRYSASQMLERFLFPLHTHGTPIGKLSGGERKRLHLLKLLMEQPNVLLLDEPTNDLDIETLGVLEDFIEHFPGVVIAISHDRFFLDRIAKKLWILDGKGNVEVSYDLYTEYLMKKAEAEKNGEKEEKQVKPKKEKPKSEKKKLTYKEQKEWETIEGMIAQVEQEIMEIEERMASCGSDYVKLQEYADKLNELNAEYERLIERWSYLNDIVNEGK
ncbi:ABC-F family ATP-binding cassette domain-containing protein [Ureibacillus terrenus]|uniref:ABC-F family ATP-binding cassette domain-containing protein n=1 Tax=Ureibacillus terrenus TaxID=118246 RepID=A0A540V4Q9_9BACL|nr:ABC-F family ATP-binding cassette domain-containing protein [Ureibacillus terrenus]TQE91741.1 ABC-F family ATP-binding cassette domain-containing protein [Ureibacillus terrenus]